MRAGPSAIVRASCGLAAVLALAGAFALGFAVTRGGEPAPLAAIESAWLNHSTLIAWWLTWTCYPYVLVPVSVALLGVAWRAPAWRGRVLFSIAMLLLCWLCADQLQHAFARPRRLDWVVKHETSFSYPSSHAAISTGFYGLWAVLLAVSSLPRAVRAAGAAALVVLVAAVCWARLALGAHYVTDLAGGVLVGAGVVAAGAAVVGEKVLGVPGGARVE